MQADIKSCAQVLRTLGDENRLLILQLLRQGEKCASEILDALEISQSTLSHHMKTLCETEIVHTRKAGKRTYYCLNPGAAMQVIFDISQILGCEIPSSENPRQMPVKKTPAKKNENFQPWL